MVPIRCLYIFYTPDGDHFLAFLSEEELLEFDQGGPHPFSFTIVSDIRDAEYLRNIREELSRD
jgi:hypothetical protein